MTKSFTATMDELIAQAKGGWTAKVEVNQVYAHNQEAHAEYHHPSGGQAFYLRDTLYLGQWVNWAARGMIDHEGLHIKRQMVTVANGFVHGVYMRAPWEFEDLRRSGAPSVLHDGEIVYTKPPEVARLTPEQLRQKKHMSYLIDPRRYKRGKG